jgi:hypothetical protein
MSTGKSASFIFEGSRFVRGARYGISIDFGLEVHPAN